MTAQARQCDLARIADFLGRRLSQSEQAVFEEHLSGCPACRESLASQAADAELWDKASRYLRDDADELHPVPAGSNSASAEHDRALSIGHVLDALGPTDDPQMLGRLGGLEVSGVIGAGAMGVVLKGLDKSLDRTVAIKVMASHLASHGAARKRFAREAKAAAAVMHPNVMPIHSVSNNERLPYLVMPYLRGASLQKRIDDEGPLPPAEILRISSQIAQGLQAAHAQGLVHRDIKPANILLEEGVERVAITDFGLARAVDDASMTRTGVIAGTPQFMSPEQARGESVDPRSDLFSLGSVMYTMCAGRPPFRAETSYGVLRRITDSRPRPIRELNPDVPAWLCAIVDKLMSKRAEDRFASAEEVAGLLDECLAHVQHPTVVPLPESLREPPSRKFGFAGAAVSAIAALIVLLGFAFFGLWFWQTAHSRGAGGDPPRNASGNEARQANGADKREEEQRARADAARPTIDIAPILARRKSFAADDPRRQAKVELVLDKMQFFLGENILLHYRVSNGGDEPFTIEMGGDSNTGSGRPLRFKVLATQNGALVRDPYPVPDCLGGPLMSQEIKPGETFWFSLPLMRYCDFEKAGTYRLTVYHDLGWDAYDNQLKNELPAGEYLAPVVETQLELVMPDKDEARGVLQRTLELPLEPNASFGRKTRDYADFTTLRYPVYLPLLKDVTNQGDQRGVMATTAIGEIATPKATSALIDLALKHPNPVVAADAEQRLLFRMPYPHVEERRAWSSQWDRKYRFAQAWRDEHRAPVLELGWKLLAAEDRESVMKGASVLFCLGRKEDFPRLLGIIDRVLNDMALDDREQLAYPRPGTASGSVIDAGWQLIERGADVPPAPKTAGELALFMRAVGLRENFRPDGWEQVAAKAMRHPIPFVRAVAIENLPKPLPMSLYKSLLPRLQDSAPPVQIAALEAAAASGSPEFLDAVMQVLKNPASQWIRDAANRTRRACRGG